MQFLFWLFGWLEFEPYITAPIRATRTGPRRYPHR